VFELMKNASPKDFERRCPMLGGAVTLAYCEQCGEAQKPCHKIFDCWWENFDVAGYLEGRLTAEEYQNLIHSRPQSKFCSLLDCIEKARSRH
jgi:hypothetical protein